jgi:hypothetical protein
MSVMSPRDSCRDLFRKLQIIPLLCEYILSLMLFVIDNRTKFCSGSHFHTLNTRNREQLYLPNANLSVFQNGPMFSAIKLFNRLTKIIQNLEEDGVSFRNKLSLMSNSFYTVSEYLECNLNNYCKLFLFYFAAYMFLLFSLTMCMSIYLDL